MDASALFEALIISGQLLYLLLLVTISNVTGRAAGNLYRIRLVLQSLPNRILLQWLCERAVLLCQAQLQGMVVGSEYR
ncbi:hypothetical protein ASD64_19585 [Mesorhizobium sp. Root157]|nr:hypothetical protein ASD64_19585 [Mesorhizobium sp. Root157]